MIKNIYDDINGKLAGLGLAAASNFFSFDFIPDSLADNSYFISVPDFSNGDFVGASTDFPVFNLKPQFKINLCMKFTANEIQNFIIDSAEKLEDIIKAVLSIAIGGDEKDKIVFAGSNSIVKDVYLITEINFNFNYRISNL